MTVDELPVREKRTGKASLRLGGDNGGELLLTSHRAAHEEQIRKEKEKAEKEKAAKARVTAEKAKGSSFDFIAAPSQTPNASTSATKRTATDLEEIRDSDSGSAKDDVQEIPPPAKKKKSES